MKYFTFELLDKSCNPSDPEYEEADKLWMENLTTYWNQFEQYKSRLPVRFTKEYCEHAFHDYTMKSISLYNENKGKASCYVVKLELYFDNTMYIIKYSGVTKYSLDINSIINKTDITLLYSEILPIDANKMSHEILFTDRNICYIEFKQVSFKKIIL